MRLIDMCHLRVNRQLLFIPLHKLLERLQQVGEVHARQIVLQDIERVRAIFSSCLTLL